MFRLGGCERGGGRHLEDEGKGNQNGFREVHGLFLRRNFGANRRVAQ
jgi:hypothetical protein